MPYVRFALSAAKPTDYPNSLDSLGDHLRARRLDLGLLQKEAADHIGVDDWTIINWEKNRTTPPIRFWPNIIDFLGYDPHCPPRTMGERIKAIRRNLGYSVKRLARQIDVDESTVTRWERGPSTPSSDHWDRIGKLISNVGS